ncbi:MAG: putative transposase [Ulvibacter sp.]|jgi:putative transposase
MGYRKITAMLKLHKKYNVNKKRISRLMKSMNIRAIYSKPNLSKSDDSYKYPYLLNDIDIVIPNQVWETDITYIRLKQGFVYLLAIIDVFSRYVVSWKISNNMEIDFCLSALEDALRITKPIILNTDQGSQFTSHKWVNTVLSNDIKVSMDGKGRWADNIFIERFWRSVKYEEIFINPPDDFIELKSNIKRYINFYNNVRPHQSLNYTTPSTIFTGG